MEFTGTNRRFLTGVFPEPGICLPLYCVAAAQRAYARKMRFCLPGNFYPTVSGDTMKENTPGRDGVNFEKFLIDLIADSNVKKWENRKRISQLMNPYDRKKELLWQKILYVYNDQVYANITNKCDCNCTFCIRKQFDGVGDADTLWHKAEPSLSEIIAAIDAFDFTGYKEFVFCGYGEPTCALENLIASARYVKRKNRSPDPCQFQWSGKPIL